MSKNNLTIVGMVISGILLAGSIYRWSITSDINLEFAWLVATLGWFASFIGGIKYLKK